MRKLRSVIPSSFLAASLAFSASGALAQDPTKVAPEIYKVTAENKYVRVLDIHLKAGGKSPMHSHPGYVAVALSPCRVRFISAQGKTQVVEFKPGEASWREAESHSVENVGTTQCHALNVEVKSAAARTK